MSVTYALSGLWAQASGPALPAPLLNFLKWMFVLGEPTVTQSGALAGPITWMKVIGLFCLLGWASAWVVTAIKERAVRKAPWLDVLALLAVIGMMGSVLLRVLETTKRIPILHVSGQLATSLLGAVCALVIVVWAERLIWSVILRLGKLSDRLVLGGMHLALAAGVGVSFVLFRTGTHVIMWQDALVQGARLGATYMGFVVLFHVAWLMATEMFAMRWRRLYSIAWHTVMESLRRMWAPYVVVTVFLVILAFTDWFLRPDQDRAAELGRLYVGTLALLCSLLLTVMVAILTPLSLPYDIQQQTIYTVVSKPVRRLELVWGRILGFMFLVSVILGLFGGICLLYLDRTVGGAIAKTDTEAVKAAKQNRPERVKQLREEADQLRNRMSARVPVYGSLSFLDSRGKQQIKGIDVGQELEYRSHVEGATQAVAIWEYGMVRDPIDVKLATLQPGHPIRILDRRLPVERFLTRGTVEWLLNRVAELRQREQELEARSKQPNLPANEGNRIAADLAQTRQQRQRSVAEYDQLKAQAQKIDTQLTAAQAAGNKAEVDSLQRQSRTVHSPPIPVEMTFTVYRTTKGVVGEPVFASIKAINPRTGEDRVDVFPIREYYTNKVGLSPALLAGSQGSLRIEIKCISATQYLGMAEKDLFLLAKSDQFGWNFWKGLVGIWLQAMVLTAIGVWAGTFLSWPVALLTTIAFFVAGQVAFGFLQEFAMQSLTMQGGGPFESLIRLLSHDNLQNELTPTLAVVSAKTLDGLVMPVMSRLVYIVPNFAALDVSNTVADGFAVTESLLAKHTLLALAYAIPFSVAGYFILKHREVAA